MTITKKTEWSKFAPFDEVITDETRSAIMQGARAEYGDYYDLTFADFWQMCNGDFTAKEPQKLSVFFVYWRRGFMDWVQNFIKTLAAMQIPPTADEQTAAEELLKVDFFEGTLVFLREYFNLPNFVAAERITIGELLIARRDAYNKIKYNKKLNAIQIKKLKR